MKDLKNITEFQLLTLASCELYRKIAKEQEINERTRKEQGRDNRISQHRIRLYDAQLKEIQERELEIRNNNNSNEETEETNAVEGKWVKPKTVSSHALPPEAVCSLCGRKVVYQKIDGHWGFENFCPHCGATMKNSGV
ncbi:MAG: hypothetical protein ACI4HM_03710 [Ruminococcus sp.]